jgi:hypothetical protein
LELVVACREKNNDLVTWLELAVMHVLVIPRFLRLLSLFKVEVTELSKAFLHEEHVGQNELG